MTGTRTRAERRRAAGERPSQPTRIAGQQYPTTTAGHARPVFELPKAPDPKQTTVRKQGPADGASLRKRGRGGGINEIRLQDPKQHTLQVQPEGIKQALRGPPGPKANGRTILGIAQTRPDGRFWERSGARRAGHDRGGGPER